MPVSMLVLLPKAGVKKGLKIILREREKRREFVALASQPLVFSNRFIYIYISYIETHREFVALVAGASCLSTVFIATAIATMAGVKADGRQAGGGLDGSGARGGGGGGGDMSIDTYTDTYMDKYIAMQGRCPMIWALVVLNLFFILGAAAVLLLQVESERVLQCVANVLLMWC